MRTSDADILILPGLNGSGPDHWQSRWEAKLKTARRIEMANWDRPHLETWVEKLVAEVHTSTRPVILVAHSLGVLTVAHAAPRLAHHVKGAFLVAPPTESSIQNIDVIDPAFTPIPDMLFPFPSVLVASRDDTYAAFHESEALASQWGSAFTDAGAVGHINTESGHGPWPEGLMRFAGFLNTI